VNVTWAAVAEDAITCLFILAIIYLIVKYM
jgi:hypothetical protein